MPRWNILLLATAVFVCLVETSMADTLADCRQSRNGQLRLAGCSALLADPAAPRADKLLAYRNRGQARLDAGALDQAIADLSEAIRLEANDERAHVLRAQARLGLKDLNGAIADFNSAIRIDTRSTAALSGRGYAELLRGNVTAAIADFSRVISLSPVSTTAYNNRGLAYRRAGDLDLALADYTTAITLNPIYAVAYENRGHVREQRGEKELAIADHRRALLIDPALAGSRAALQRLGAGADAAESERLIGDGENLVEAHCSRCHATGRQGDSPNRNAPPFRDLRGRHPILALREPLTRGITAPHDEMPHFAFPDSAIDRIIAYINSLGGSR